MLDIFRRLTARRADRRWLTALVLIGYLAACGMLGVAAHLAYWGVAVGVRHSEWLIANVWVIGAAILVIAGGYQFTELKYRCLDKCRPRLALSSSTGAVRARNGKPFFWTSDTAHSA